MTVDIKDVQILDKQANKLSARVIMYDLSGSSATVYWWLSNSESTNLYDGNCELGEEVVENWGLDDMVILEAVADKMGFEVIS